MGGPSGGFAGRRDARRQRRRPELHRRRQIPEEVFAEELGEWGIGNGEWGMGAGKFSIFHFRFVICHRPQLCGASAMTYDKCHLANGKWRTSPLPTPDVFQRRL